LIDGAKWGNLLHDFALAAECTDWHAAADDFAECREIGLDPVERLSAAQCNAETRHDFIEDQN
jgi:hypothetical protein